MHTPLKIVRKVTVALVGFPLLALGIILIPVPGPGLLVCFLALIILSMEFRWADSLRSKASDRIKTILRQSRAKQAETSKDNVQPDTARHDNKDF